MSKNEELETWKKIWERKGNIISDDLKLKELIAIDGFDTGAGAFPVDSWLSFVEKIKIQLNINKNHKILEIGCGAGAFLLPLYNSQIAVYGIDYSKSLVELCTKTMKSGVFKMSEAKKIPFKNEYFNAVVSNSTFQYFSDLEYAKNVLCEVNRVLKKKGRAALLDINDAEKKDEYESIRKEALGEEEYDRLYGNLKHQFYNKEWFEKTANNLGLNCKVKEQNISGYSNSEFRYNVFLEK